MASGWHRKRSTPASKARAREYATPAYRAARKAAKRQVDTGTAHCWRPTCRRWLDPSQPWHLGHDDHDRAIIRGPECVDCNLTAAARKGARTRNQDTRITRLTW